MKSIDTVEGMRYIGSFAPRTWGFRSKRGPFGYIHGLKIGVFSDNFCRDMTEIDPDRSEAYGVFCLTMYVNPLVVPTYETDRFLGPLLPSLGVGFY